MKAGQRDEARPPPLRVVYEIGVVGVTARVAAADERRGVAAVDVRVACEAQRELACFGWQFHKIDLLRPGTGQA